MIQSQRGRKPKGGAKKAEGKPAAQKVMQTGPKPKEGVGKNVKV